MPLTIKAVIFDFFGTLVPNFSFKEHTAVLRKMAKTVGAPVDPFVNQWLATYDQRAKGFFKTIESNIKAICSGYNLSPSDTACSKAAELRFNYEQEQIKPRPSALATLKALRNHGYKLGLISDCSSELPIIWKETVFSPLFDCTLFSSLIGIRKPDPLIYLQAAKQLNVQCSACLYIGDGGSQELSGAAAVGMHPLLLYDKEEQHDDTQRIDSESWQGQRILGLHELLSILN